MKTNNSKTRNGGWTAGLFTIRLPLIVAAIGILLAGCVKEKKYLIGDIGPGGGRIFYVSEEVFGPEGKWHYLEAAPEDMSGVLAWASSDYIKTEISGTKTGLGRGADNTAAILAVDANAPAAKACRDYRGGNKSDWFLPSIEELRLMYKNLVPKALGNFQGSWYWSSSQYDYAPDYDSPYFGFFNGTIPSNIGEQFTANFHNYRKGDSASVRAVRAF